MTSSTLFTTSPQNVPTLLQSLLSPTTTNNERNSIQEYLQTIPLEQILPYAKEYPIVWSIIAHTSGPIDRIWEYIQQNGPHINIARPLSNLISDLTTCSREIHEYLRQLMPSELALMTLARLCDADSLPFVSRIIMANDTPFDTSGVVSQALHRALVLAALSDGQISIDHLPPPFNHLPALDEFTLDLHTVVYTAFPNQIPPPIEQMDYTLYGITELVELLPERYKQHATIPLLEHTQVEDRTELLECISKPTLKEYIAHRASNPVIASAEEANALANALFALRELEDDIQCIPQFLEWLHTPHPELQAQCLGIIARNADAKSAELTLQALSSNEKVLQQAAVRALQFHLPIPSSYLPRIVQVGDIDDVCDLLALTGCEGVEDWAVNAVASHLDQPYVICSLMDLDIPASRQLYDIGIKALQTTGLESSGFEILKKFKNPELPAQIVEFACSRDDLEIVRLSNQGAVTYFKTIDPTEPSLLRFISYLMSGAKSIQMMTQGVKLIDHLMPDILPSVLPYLYTCCRIHEDHEFLCGLIRIISYGAAIGQLVDDPAVLRKWIGVGLDCGYSGIITSAAGLIQVYQKGFGSNILVDGDLIVEDVGRIKTRAIAKARPDRFVQTPLRAMILKLLLAEISDKLSNNDAEEEIESSSGSAQEWESIIEQNDQGEKLPANLIGVNKVGMITEFLKAAFQSAEAQSFREYFSAQEIPQIKAIMT